ncbi:MAG: PorV/PorQ family protein [Longimicrobiales bacterium]
MRPRRPGLAGFTAALLALPGPNATAQEAGTTGAIVLELPAGSRATGLAGAFTAGHGDIDALFYNPAGAATLEAAVGLAYQLYVADVAIGSAAGALRLRRAVVGLAIQYLDGGTVDVIEPDPDFGGERGRATDLSVSAGETAVRLVAALPLLADRLRLGLAAGYVARDIAGANDGAPLFDAGAQYDVGPITLGTALRNLGGDLNADTSRAVAMPAEARLGASSRLAVSARLAATVGADLLTRLEGSGSALRLGAELALTPSAHRPLTALARAGYSTAAGSGGLGGNLHVGAGLGLGVWAIDYTWQNLDYFGSIHRFGLRWQRAASALR